MVVHITTFIKITLLIKVVKSEDSDTELFEKFKNNYHRVYYNLDSEQKGYLNFVNNLDQVKKLNKEHPGAVVAYQLNRYADLDPVAVKDHYGIEMQPYDHVEDEKEAKARIGKPHKFLEDMHLYDLNDVEDLYEDFVKKFGKNHTKKLDQTIHYYRFIKTVVETNKKIFAGENAELNADADVVREPDQYFYG